MEVTKKVNFTVKCTPDFNDYIVISLTMNF